MIKPVFICASVCPSVRTLTVTDIKTKKEKRVHLGINITPPFPYFAPKPILGQEVLKIHANINNPVSDLNIRELPKFLHLLGNQDRGTR